MKTTIATYIGVFISLFWYSAALAQVNVEMIFKPHEITMPADTAVHICANLNCSFYRQDTCGIRTGATIGQDPYETDWPPIVAFDTRLTQGPEIGIPYDSLGQGYIDMRPPPDNIPPYIVDYEIIDALRNPNNDTLVLSWDSLPAMIDSIHIEDIGADSGVFGTFVQKFISHISSFPDSLVWKNPQLVVIQNFRVRVFYNKNVANTSGVAESGVDPSSADMLAYPNPANDYVQFNVPGNAPTQIVLSDMLGRNLREMSGNDLQNSIRRMSLAGLPEGMYMLSAYGKNSAYKTQIAVIR